MGNLVQPVPHLSEGKRMVRPSNPQAWATQALMRSDAAINSKIYNNKLIILCGKGYALTYVQNAAEFDGIGAGLQLLARYDGFSRQRKRSQRKTIEQLRHTSRTSMPDHIDLFEKICGQIASSGNPDCNRRRKVRCARKLFWVDQSEERATSWGKEVR
jgi:hypothetical protein